MNSTWPKQWEKISQEQWDDILRSVDYRREAYTNGFYYHFARTSQRFAFVTNAGDIFADKQLLRIDQ